MAESKKYFFLKLKENFFDTDEMIILESMPDGYLYSNILLKLYLRSLKYDGRLMFNERIPFNSTMLAQVTRHNVGVIEKAMKVYQDLGLVEILDNGAIYMLDIQNFIGKSSTEADRVREYRKMIEQEKTCTNVQLSYDKRTPELEKEKELDLEIEKEKELDNSFGDKSPESSRHNYSNYIKEIVDYLNYICGTNYKSTTKATTESIKARLKEGFTVDDFKTVIDKKFNEWGNDPKMVQYLRPQTLFGSKFEGYLNQIATDGRQLSETDKALLRWMNEPQEETQSNALMLGDDIF